MTARMKGSEEMRTIKVTGKGTLRLAPDTTRLTVTLRGTYRDYAEALRRSAEGSDKLRELSVSLGFESADLKTLSFDVDARYEGVHMPDGTFRQQFAGYEFTHVLKLEFPSDNDLLGKLLSAFAGSGVEPELQISYTVKDKESAKTALLESAVKSAREKAETLCSASGVTLNDIQSIDYSLADAAFETRPMARGLMAAEAMKSAAFDAGIVPDDIEVSDTVTVVWEIE